VNPDRIVIRTFGWPDKPAISPLFFVAAGIAGPVLTYERNEATEFVTRAEAHDNLELIRCTCHTPRRGFLWESVSRSGHADEQILDQITV
jgi:hypothetical protein